MNFNQRIIDSFPDELVVIDPKTRKIVLANSKVFKNYKRKDKEIINRFCYKTFHPERGATNECPLHNTLKSGKTEQIVQERVVNGKKRYYSIRTTPIKDTKGKIDQILHITKDITNRKLGEISLHESRERYMKLVQNAPLGIIAVSTSGEIMNINQTLLQILGSKSLKVTRSINVLQYKPLMAAGIATDFEKCIDKGRSIVAEHEYTSRWGKTAYLRYHLTPIRSMNNDIIGVQGIVEDCTERKRSEGELRKVNMNLMTLYKTSSNLQETLDVREVFDIAIETFQSIGFDRVRIYIMKNGQLRGVRSSHLADREFKQVALELSKKFPKAYKAISKKEPVILKKHITKYSKLLDKLDVDMSASLPLISKDRVMGIISIDNKYSKKEIDKEDLNNLMTFANQIAVAIENSMLYDLNRERLNTLETLYDVSTVLSGTLDLSKVLNLIVIRIVKLLKADVCSLMLTDTNELSLKTIYDIHEQYSKKFITRLGEIIGKKTIASMSYQYVKDIAKEKGLGKVDKKGLVSMLSVPLSIENKPIGVITIFTSRERAYSRLELNLLRSLSHQAAIAIENSKLYETIKSDKNNLTALLDLSQAITSTFDQDKLLELILNKAVDFTKAEYGFIMLIEDEYLRLKLSRGFNQNRLDKLTLNIGEGIVGNVAKYGQPIIVSDVSLDDRYISISDDIQSEAAIPISAQNKLIGVLDLESRKKENFKRFQKSLNILTNQIAIAIENARLYDEISNFNKRLKNEIEIATQELRRKNIELQKMDQLKSEFVSNVSHELRTPLTSIAGYTKLMYMKKLGPINVSQESSLKIIAEEAERLTRLINNVLDLSKLEAGKIKFKLEKIDISEIASHTITTMTQTAKEKNITLNMKSQKIPKFKASRDLVKQIFINLLNNALKFTESNGRIDVDLRKNKKIVELSVKDTGKGIDKEQIPKLFDKFYQVDTSMTREYGGTGLGLVIVKHIVDAHKGSIKVRSEPGKGSEFVVTLPFRK